MAFDGEPRKEDALHAARALERVVVEAQVAPTRLRASAASSPRAGRLVDFRVLERGSGANKRAAHVEAGRQRLIAGARQALADRQSRLARLLALEAARPSVNPGGEIGAELEGILREVLDLPVRLLQRIEAEGAAVTAAYSPDGRWLAVAGRGAMVRLYSVEDPEVALDLTPAGYCEPVMALAWAKDGTRLAATGHLRPRDILVWDTSALAEREVPAPTALSVEDWFVWGVQFAPDGLRLLGADLTTRPPAVGLWNELRGAAIRLPHEGRVAATGFSADGALIATAGEDGRLGLWDGRTGAHLRWLVQGEVPVGRASPRCGLRRPAGRCCWRSPPTTSPAWRSEITGAAS